MDTGDETERLGDEELLAERAWMRAFARALLEDDETAEDVVQDVTVAALESRPQRRRSARPWLATVIRNRVRTRRKTDANRRARELARAGVDRGSVQEPTDDAVAQAELRALLLGCLSELEEPLRSTIEARFLAERSPAQIASETDTPAGTVRWRISEGLERLRARLDERHGGDRAAWSHALLPILREERADAVLGASTPLASIAAPPLLWTAVVAAVALVAVLVLGGPDDPVRRDLGDVARAPVDVVERPSETAADEDGVAPSESESLTPERDDVTVVEVDQPGALGLEDPPETDAWLIVDVSGEPQAGLELGGFWGAGRSTDAAGVVRMLRGVPPKPGEGWSVVARGERPAGEPRRVLVVAPSIAIEGLVVDEQDRPLAGARASVQRWNGLDELPFALLAVEGKGSRTSRSGEDGRFRIENVPSLDRLEVEVRQDGFRRARIDVLPDRVDVGVVQLEPEPESNEFEFHGLVEDALGRPLSGVEVIVAGWSRVETVTDEAGRYVVSLAAHLLDPLWGEVDLRVYARHEAHGLVASRGTVGERLQPPPTADDPHVLSFPARPTGISGRLLDAEGEPLAGWKVQPASAVDWHAEEYDVLLVEELEQRQAATTDDSGRFDLHPLFKGEYSLLAVSPRGTRAFRSPGFVSPDRGVVWRFRQEDTVDVVGRLVDPEGQPLAGVRVDLGMPTWHHHSSHRSELDQTQTDADGRFSFAGAPTDGVWLQFRDGEAQPPLDVRQFPLDEIELLHGRATEFVVGRMIPLWITLLGEIPEFSVEDKRSLELVALTVEGEQRAFYNVNATGMGSSMPFGLPNVAFVSPAQLIPPDTVELVFRTRTWVGQDYDADGEWNNVYVHRELARYPVEVGDDGVMHLELSVPR